MAIAYVVLAARIFVLGYEKIIIKQLGTGADRFAATFLFFVIGTLFLVPIVIVVSPAAVFSPIIFVTGAIYALAFLLYVYALSISDASLVGPLFNFNVFFLLILSALFLDETVTILKIAGLLALFIGALILNPIKGGIGPTIRSLVRDKGAVVMVVCSMLMAVGRIFDGNAVRTVHPLWYAFMLYGTISCYLFICVLVAGRLRITFELLKSRPVFAVISGCVNGSSYLLLVILFQYMEVSVAEPLSMLSIVVTLVLAWIVFKERSLSRAPGVALMLGGAWLLFL